MRMRSGFKLREKSFTLIELLVVIGIIGLLAAMLLPALSRARMQARVLVKYGSCMAGQQTKSLGVGHWTLGEGKGLKTRNWGSVGSRITSGDTTSSKGIEWVKDSRFKGYNALKFSPTGGFVNLFCGRWADYGITHKLSAEVWGKIMSYNSVCGGALCGAFGSSPPIFITGAECWHMGYFNPSGTERNAYVSLNAGGTVYSVTAKFSEDVTENDKLFLNRYNHMIFTYDGSTLKFYVNGEFKGSTPCSGDVPNGSNFRVFIGNATNPFSPVSYVIDEVVVYNRVLNKGEAADLYNMGAPSGYPIVPNY